MNILRNQAYQPMPHYQDKKILPYQPEQLFDMVLDINAYKDFLPWCRRSEIIDHIPEKNVLYASVTAGYLVYSEMYVSKVTYEKPRKIHAEYVEGPFKTLYTSWTFEEHPKGCELQFEVHFEFSASVLNALASHVLDQISTRMVEAFVRRAQYLYG